MLFILIGISSLKGLFKKKEVDWVPDSFANSCYVCSSNFTVVRRKHHWWAHDTLKFFFLKTDFLLFMDFDFINYKKWGELEVVSVALLCVDLVLQKSIGWRMVFRITFEFVLDASTALKPKQVFFFFLVHYEFEWKFFLYLLRFGLWNVNNCLVYGL